MINMALIKCSKCGHLVSDKAVECPKCGTQIPHSQSSSELDNNDGVDNPLQSEVVEDIESSGNNNKSKAGVTQLILISVLSAFIGITIGYFVFSKNGNNRENQSNLENGYYCWSSVDGYIPVCYKLQDKTVTDVFISEIPCQDARIDDNANFIADIEKIFGNEINLRIQFNLKTGVGYHTSYGNRSDITMYRVYMPNDSIAKIMEKFSARFNEVKKQYEEKVAEEEVVAVDPVADAEGTERNEWNGASTASELETKLSGTIWHCYDEGRGWKVPMYRLSFNNGVVKIQTIRFREGKGWREEYKEFPYEVSSSDNNLIYVNWGDGSNVDNMRQTVLFKNNARVADYYMESAKVGSLVFGDYIWE